nr:carboxy-terminal kinesin 2-like [Cherax quadricarinatus]
MSKLPTTVSRLRLPQGSKLKAPGSPLKRQGSGSGISSPAKRARLSSSTSNEPEDSAPEMRPPARRVARPTVTGTLRRSASMANVSVNGLRDRNSSKSNLAQSKIGASTLNFSGRPSNICASTALRSSGVVGRKPGTNITNHVNNTHSSVSKNSKTLPAASKDSEEPVTKGKPKRAAWDLKGRLQDMENLVKSQTVERDNFIATLANYNFRIENLELEKQNLNQNLQKTQTLSQAHQEEVDRLKHDLRVQIDERSAEKRNLENTIHDLEFRKSALERQMKSLEAELAARLDELSGLKVCI